MAPLRGVLREERHQARQPLVELFRVALFRVALFRAVLQEPLQRVVQPMRPRLRRVGGR
ncbi:MAG: hypothetical protein ACK6D3_01270 [Planctomycetaceae bacterium]